MRLPSLVPALALLLVSDVAFAHFHLEAPASFQVQDALGNPQKTASCGGAGTATGAVTTVLTGSTLTVSVNETIFHPGHYRISIAQNEAGLPPPPPVTQVGLDQCGSAPIDPAPQLPILADGVFQHTASFSGIQTFDVPLPPGFTCDNCTVQVLEFMSNHNAPCFYYHCATVTISDTAPPPPDAAVGGPDADETSGPDGDPGNGNNTVGGGCSAGADSAGLAGLAGLALGLLAFALRNRRTRTR